MARLVENHTLVTLMRMGHAESPSLKASQKPFHTIDDDPLENGLVRAACNTFAAPAFLQVLLNPTPQHHNMQQRDVAIEALHTLNGAQHRRPQHREDRVHDPFLDPNWRMTFGSRFTLQPRMHRGSTKRHEASPAEALMSPQTTTDLRAEVALASCNSSTRQPLCERARNCQRQPKGGGGKGPLSLKPRPH